MKKRFVAILLVLTLTILFSAVRAEVSLEQLDKLTESERATIRAQVFISLTAKKAGLSRSQYSEILGIDLGELTLDELAEIRDYLDGIKDESDMRLTTTEDFLTEFNAGAALMETGHALYVDSAETSRFSDSVLMKTVFNNCEILSLNLSADSNDVMSVKCTHSLIVPGASAYDDDFVYLLIEAMYGCGIDADSILDVLSDTGFFEHHSIGDSGEATMQDIKISYEVTSVFGVSFTIEKT